MAESEAQKAHRLKEWREKRAAKRALTGDTPQKLAERPKPGDQPEVKDNIDRAGRGGFIAGGF